MKNILALAILCIASVAHGQVEMPKTLTLPYQPGKLISIEAKSPSKVTFQLVRPDDLVIEGIAGENRLTLGMPAGGTLFYVIAAAADKAGNVTIAQCKVEITGQNPSNQEDVEVKRGAVKHATLLVDKASTVDSLAKSAAFRSELAKRGIELHVLSTAEADPEFKKLHEQSGNSFVLQGEDGSLIPNGQVFRLTLTGNVQQEVQGLLQTVDQANQ